jgi:hypothetical protein
MLRISPVIFVLVLLNTYVNAQQKSAFLVEPEKPSVYISFIKKGQLPALYQGDSDSRVWLRFTNNTRMPLFVCDRSVPSAYGDTELPRKVYKSHELGREFMPKLGFYSGDACHLREISAGKSVTFSVLAEELGDRMIIQVPFTYGFRGDWHEDMFDGIESVVGFGADQIPR